MAFEYSWAEMSKNKKQANGRGKPTAVGGRLRRIVSKIPNREVQPHNRKWLILER